MKTKFFLFVLLFCCAFSLSAQHPLIGTWQMHQDGNRSIKIITPTHWVVFTDSTSEGQTYFIRSHGGTYTLDGDKYVENIEVASWDGYGQEKTDFTFSVQDKKFYQKGTLTFADGTVYPIDEVWQKVESNSPGNSNKGLGVGTWNQLSSTYTVEDGRKESHTNATATRFQVVSPTHWVRISHRDNKFENAMGGTYTTQGDKFYPALDFASYTIDKGMKVEVTQKLKGDKLYWSGVGKDANGKQVIQFDDVFQKVNNKKMARVTPNK